jgi:hypothetical protein
MSYAQVAHTFKVLVIAHRGTVFAPFAPVPHFDSAFFRQQIAKYKHASSKVKTDTVDILTNDPGMDLQGNYHYRADAFSDKFVNEHDKEYDLIFLPDCAGVWWNVQNPVTDKSAADLAALMMKIFTMVKPNGSLFASKILCAEEDVMQHLSQYTTAMVQAPHGKYIQMS